MISNKYHIIHIYHKTKLQSSKNIPFHAIGNLFFFLIDKQVLLEKCENSIKDYTEIT